MANIGYLDIGVLQTGSASGSNVGNIDIGALQHQSDQNLDAGANTATFTAPTATLALSTLLLSAGVNVVNFTNPSASLTLATLNLSAGSNTVNFSSPTAIIVNPSSGQTPRASKYRWGHIVHWVNRRN